MNINEIMTELLRKNRKVVDEVYKNAYCDGVLDFYNTIKDEKEE